MVQLTALCKHDLESWTIKEGLLEPREATADVMEALRAAHHGQAGRANVSMGLALPLGDQYFRGDTVPLRADFGWCAADV